ncbi:MAG: hypothetical protein HC848_01875 [Limnobacter sp.]|nr:hypothetical protein [Limnobacter sp.]
MISKQALEQRQNEHARNQAELKSAAAAVQLASANTGKCTIRAPFTGVVTEKKVAIGQLAMPATAMLRLVDLEIRKSPHTSQPLEVKSLRASSEIYFSQGEKRYPLTIRQITPVVDQQRNTQEARLIFPQEKPLPGSSGELVWRHPEPVLAAEYLSQRQGSLGILLAKSDKAKTQVDFYPLADAQEGQPVPVTFDERLTPDTRVLTEGRFAVAVGDEVRISETPAD